MEVLELKDVKAVPDIIHSYPDRVKSEATPLVIDNGNLNLLYRIVLYHTNIQVKGTAVIQNMKQV